MSRTTGRTMALLGLLQSRREWSGSELRRRLEVSDRTLRRDIDDLRELGYGIEATRGVGGGYRLGPGAALPPLTLTEDEAAAIAVGLRVAAGSVITGIEDAAARALAKLEQSLSSGTREQISDVERSIVLLAAPTEEVAVGTMTTLARAISGSRMVLLRYRRHDGREVERTVQPHRIVHTPEHWYLVARDADQGGWRHYRLDRVDSVRTLPTTFTPHRIPDDELRRFTSHSISTAPYPLRARLRVRAEADAVRRSFGPAVADVVDLGDGTSMLSTGGTRAEEIALYLGLSGFEIEVVEGDEVREAFRRLAGTFSAAAGN